VEKPIKTQKYVLLKENLSLLWEVLHQESYTIIAPTVDNQAIIYDEVEKVEDLPMGWTHEREANTYRLKKRQDQAFFAYTVAAQSWKKFLYPATQRLWQAKRTDGTFEVQVDNTPVPKYAFIGVRACELHAILIQDKIFLEGFVDSTYQKRREQALIVAVNCTHPDNTCFCASMHTGPKADKGFDLALTEVLAADKHYFLVEIGSDKGQSLLAKLPYQKATQEEIQTANELMSDAVQHMGRSLDTTNLKELLYRNYENPEWEAVAQRCLDCANCTMVCPTCFCTTMEDITDLSGDCATRVRKWDSCFTMDFSYIHGGSIRYSPKARYRQWMTHKLATWVDQFGSFGCVGCGRCITWCPVGIDITQEVQVIREHDGAKVAIKKGE
jgi:ferredoxin